MTLSSSESPTWKSLASRTERWSNLHSLLSQLLKFLYLSLYLQHNSYDILNQALTLLFYVWSSKVTRSHLPSRKSILNHWLLLMIHWLPIPQSGKITPNNTHLVTTIAKLQFSPHIYLKAEFTGIGCYIMKSLLVVFVEHSAPPLQCGQNSCIV